MNYKQFVPTYRRRIQFVGGHLDQLLKEKGRAKNALHLGCGEGDLDHYFSRYVESMVSVDINASDVDFARTLNHDIPNVTFQVDNACALSFEDDAFDLVICLETIEHVTDHRLMMAELARVCAPGATLILSFPSANFPVTYDPINRLLGRGKRLISAGAYGFGHDWLPDPADIRADMIQRGFEITADETLSGPVVGLIECYVPGLLQSRLKHNAANVDDQDPGQSTPRRLRPDRSVPKFVWAVDVLNAVDQRLTGRYSVGVGQCYRKRA